MSRFSENRGVWGLPNGLQLSLTLTCSVNRALLLVMLHV